MKQLQILNAVLAATGAAFGVVLAVVCVIYAVYLDTAPRLQAEMPLLLTATGSFLALMAAGGLAFLGHRRAWNLRWLVQLLPALPLAGIVAFLASLKV